MSNEGVTMMSFLIKTIKLFPRDEFIFSTKSNHQSVKKPWIFFKFVYLVSQSKVTLFIYKKFSFDIVKG